MASSLNSIYQQLDTLSFDFIQKSYSGIVAQYEGVFTLLLTGYIVCYAMAVIRAKVSLSPIEVGVRLMVISLVYVYATQYAYYHELGSALFFTAEHLIATVMPYSNPSLDQANMVQVLSDSYGHALNVFSEIWQNGGINNVGAYLLALLGYLVFTLMAIVACGILLLAKVMLTLLLALAPIFIILLLFNATQQFFYNWLNQLVSWMLVPVFLFTLLGLYLIVLDTELAATLQANRVTFTAIVPLLIIALASIISFSYIPQIAAQIGGGFVSGVGSSVKPMATQAVKWMAGGLATYVESRRMQRTLRRYSQQHSQRKELIKREDGVL